MNNPTPAFSNFSAQSAAVDWRKRGSILEFLTQHDTHRDGMGAVTPKFAANVKIAWWGLRIPEPYLSAVFAVLAADDPMPYLMIGDLFSDFHSQHPEAVATFAGRSNGWIELHITPDPFEYDGIVNGVDQYQAELSFSELRALARLVAAFDVLCDEAVALFVDYAAAYIESDPQPEGVE